METGFFIGRDNELELFISEISESDQFKDPSRIFFLSGQRGLGKKSFYGQLWKYFCRSPLKVIWVRLPSVWQESHRQDDWLEMMSASIEANNDVLKNRIGIFRQSWSEASKGMLQGAGGQKQAVNKGVLWLDLFAKILLERKSLASGQAEKNLRILFVLDDYDRLDSEHKQWFSQSVFNPLVSAVPDLDVRFLLSGEHSFYTTLDLESYWGPFQTEVREVVLPPLNSIETNEFASRLKVTLGEGFDLQEVTGGIPEKIRALLKNGTIKKSDQRAFNDVDSNFEGLSQENVNWILGAAHLRIFNDEALNIFGTAEGALRARKWLCNLDFLKIEKRNLSFVIDSSWADSILHWQEKNQPVMYRKLAAKVESYREICQHIPLLEHRQKLAKLSVFNFFNEDLVHKVYGELAPSLNAFVRVNLQYFIKTPFNYQISMQYQPFVQSYVRLIPIEDKEQTREKAMHIWNKRKEVAIAEIAEIEKKLLKERKVFDEHRVLLDPLIKQVNQRVRMLVKAQKKKNEKLNRASTPEKPKSKQSMLPCLFFNVCGVSLMAVGMLFTVPLDWNYVVLGAFFVFIGTFGFNDDELVATQSVAKSVDKNQIDPTADDTLIAMLNLKRVGLENKSSYLSMLINRYQQRLRELDTLLSEPYVF